MCCMTSGCNSIIDKAFEGEEVYESKVKDSELKDNDKSESKKKEDKDLTVDLTMLEKNTAFAEMYAIYISPEDYEGKKLKMRGSFIYMQEFDDNNTPIPEKYLPACVISDPMGCCNVGIEFYLGENYKFPDDYPEVDEIITLEGDIHYKEKGGGKVPELVNVKIEQ